MVDNAELKNKKLKQLKALQQMFAAKLPSTMLSISDEWEKLIKLLPDRFDVENFHRQIHSLAGSAGSFGFYNLGKKAKEIETLVMALCEDQTNQHILNQLEQLINDLQALSLLTPKNNAEEQILTRTKAPAYTQDFLVYLLEDDSSLAEQACKQLEDFGYEVKCFLTGKDLIEASNSNPPQALLIDIHLPEGDNAGPEAVKIIREKTGSDIPIIFISSSDTWQTRLNAIRAGGHAYLVKPINFHELIEQLDLLTGKRKTSRYRILIVDDSELIAQHYATVLEIANMEVKIVHKPHGLLEILSAFTPDLILMDLYMPDCSGFEATQIIRQTSIYTNIPIVYLSTEKNLEDQLNAMLIGGDDFLQKPIKDEHLVKAVSLRAKRFRDLSSLMNKDSLTGLLNNINIKLALEREVALSIRNSKTMSFVMLDIDNFKNINDNYGHPEGDKVIKTLARLLGYRLRKGDICGRYGGEEFAIILPETNPEAAKKVVDSLREIFCQMHFQTGSKNYSVSFSAGIASYPEISDTQELLAAADRALYQSKNEGRNRVSIFKH